MKGAGLIGSSSLASSDICMFLLHQDFGGFDTRLGRDCVKLHKFQNFTKVQTEMTV